MIILKYILLQIKMILLKRKIKIAKKRNAELRKELEFKRKQFYQIYYN